MSEQLFEVICIVMGFASAAVGGVFLSFSDFVMRGFSQAAPTSAVDCMQELNKTVFRSIFLVSFLALTPITIGFAIYSGNKFIYAASAIYFVSVFIVTIRGNVPMNEKLDKMEKGSEEAISYWGLYLVGWTRWNHIRTVGSFVTSILFLIA